MENAPAANPSDPSTQNRSARWAIRLFVLMLALGLFVLPLLITPLLSRRLGVMIDEAPGLVQWTVDFSEWSLGRSVPHHIPGAPFTLFGAVPVTIFLSLLLRREFRRPGVVRSILAFGAAPLLLQIVALAWALAAPHATR